MRIRLAALGTLVVAMVVAGSLGESSRADGARRPKPPALVEVTFDLYYGNHWWYSSGTRGACEEWLEDEGDNDVWVQNLGANAKPNRLKPLRGQLSFGGSVIPSIPGAPSIPGKPVAPSTWAVLNAVGDATGAIRRRWEQDGGPVSSPCDGRPVEPFRKKPDDCRNVPFSTRAATIRATYSKSSSSLSDLTDPSGSKKVVSVSVPLGDGRWRLPFTKCWTTGPQFFQNFGLPVTKSDIRALRTLGIGQTYRLSWQGKKHLFGPCFNDPNDARSGCEFEIRGWIEIRHVRAF